MKRIFAALALTLWAAISFGQSYPSPTYNAVNVNGSTNATSASTGSMVTSGGLGVAKDIYAGGSYHGAIISASGQLDNIPIGANTPNTGAFTTLNSSKSTVTGSQTSPITVGGAINQTLSKSGSTGQSIYTGICSGCTSFDAHQATLTIPSGSTVTTNTSYGSYINNQNGTGTPNSGNGVNYFSVQLCGVTNANCWASNNVLIDNTSYAASTVTGVKLVGGEIDFDVTSPNTVVQGPNLTGSSLAQPSYAAGYTVSSLSVQNPSIAKWSSAFVTQDGVANVAAHWGAMATSGSNILSQPTTYNYFDGTGTERLWTQQVGGNGNMMFSDSGSGHQMQLSANMLVKPLSGTGAITLDTTGAGNQSSALFNDNGSNKYQIGKDASNNFFAYDNAASRFIWQMPSGGTLNFPIAVAANSMTLSTPLAANAGGTGTTTLNGLTAPIGSTGTVSSAITADGYAVFGRGNSSLTSNNIYEGAIGPGGNAAPAWDAVRGVAVSPAGTSILTTTGVAGYVQNDTVQGANGFTGAVGLFGVGISDADNTSTWGIDTICTDHMNQAVSTGVGRACFNEFDLNMTSPNSTASGLIIGGTWLAQPASATGVTIFKPSGTGIWQYGFGSQDAAATAFLRVGALATSANANSQEIDFHYRNASAVDSTYVMKVNGGANGILSAAGPINVTGSVAPPGSGSGLIIGNGASYPWLQTYSAPLALNPLANRVLIGTGTDDGVDMLQVNGPAKITGSISATGTGAMPLYTTTGSSVFAPHKVMGTVTLSSGSGSVTLSGNAPFASSSSYVCTANDTTAAAAVKIAQTSGTAITFTGTGSDVVQFVCTGN